MKIGHIQISGFRGFRNLVDIPIAPDFTVVDGRNGAGKSTLFDAVEYVLTGQISKYGDMKAGGESVKDYIWWKGDGPTPPERFVEVVFIDGDVTIPLRRTPISEPDPEMVRRVEAGLLNADTAPPSPLIQLCANSIIRDENIVDLSLELSETERYAKLRQAIGASDADVWSVRASSLVSIAKKRSEDAKAEVSAANSAVADATRRIDEARAALAPEAAIAEATSLMVRLLRLGSAPPDELVSPTREFVAHRDREIRDLTALLQDWERVEESAGRLADLDSRRAAATNALLVAREERELLPVPDELPADTPTAELVSKLQELHRLGTHIGVVDHGCPLCASAHDNASFAAGLARVASIIDRMDAQASEAAAEAGRRHEAIALADRKMTEAQQEVVTLTRQAAAIRTSVETTQRLLASVSLKPDAARHEVEALLAQRSAELEQARHALRVLDTLRQNIQLQSASAALEEARSRLARAQNRAGIARRAEVNAAALHDAARRAASETLDLRLERVLPLMAELYGRLRPHPVWQDIEYSIRGDLRRFLSLQVGAGLNPQFLFSSGQRRATGLAFLLSINLSLAWSRWRSILLDDPVQHVDDFRTVNLAEVLAQLVAAGRQVIVAVEDAALADLLTRRMPVSRPGSAVRLTLGLQQDGSPAITSKSTPVPMISRVLAA
jgi:chromosome segregation protein